MVKENNERYTIKINYGKGKSKKLDNGKSIDTGKFQKSSVIKPRCKGCEKKCVIVYDRHHDHHFSATCGLIIMENNIYQIDYETNPEKFWREMRRR